MSKPLHFSGIETVLWDLDGTLLDSFGIFRDLVSELLPRHNLSVPDEVALRHNFHGPLEHSIAGAAGLTADNPVVQQIAADFLTQQDSRYEIVEEHLLPDALGLAKSLAVQGITQMLVTNRAHEGRLRASPRHIVANSSLHPCISRIICGDDTHHRKPDPRVLNGLAIVPAKTLVIGDQFVDAEFAHNLQARALIVNRHGSLAHAERLSALLGLQLQVVESLENVKIAGTRPGKTVQ